MRIVEIFDGPFRTIGIDQWGLAPASGSAGASPRGSFSTKLATASKVGDFVPFGAVVAGAACPPRQKFGRRYATVWPRLRRALAQHSSGLEENRSGLVGS